MPQISPLRRTARRSQVRRWRLGVGIQYGCHHLPTREDGHGRQGPQGQGLAQLDGPLQHPRSWP